jgi:hypothetical protein
VGRIGRFTEVLSAVLLVVACGGDDDGDGADGAGAGGGTTADGGEAGGSDGDAGSGNSAVVTIGGETFEVPPDELNGCNSLDQLIFGSFAVDDSGAVTQAGGPDAAVQVNFGIPVPEWEEEGLQPPNVIVDDNRGGTRWIASEESGSGSVDSWELTDGRATGSATFVVQDLGTGTESGTESGTFELVCR